MADHVLLCLKCRQKGHDVEHCPVEGWAGEFDWSFSPARMAIDLGTSWSDTDYQVICSRCESLDLVRFFETRPPWNAQADFTDDLDKQKDFIRSLGKTGSVQFWADCSLCCCLFAITPHPSSVGQEIFLVPDWTISRVSGELGAVTMDSPEKRQYTSCLLSVLKPSTISLPTRVVAHRGDALCMLEKDIEPQATLGGRQIDSHNINVDLIHKWVEACAERHDESCLPTAMKELEEIRLIEIESRKVVEYPGPECEYVALSYVWGGVTQGNYKLGDTLQTLPKTLEDALLFTRRLGKRYVWIDSVCIDQSDEKDKANQIDRMWSIYRGAWITIIALSGTSANSGFSRFSRETYFPQLCCRIKGKTLIGLMPTLSQQIWMSPWGRRAWTLQEGLLSPRCLYVSDHQIYFDCSSMQCCESLDESQSWAHGLTPSSNPTEEGFMTWMLRQAGAGALRIPLDWPSRRLEHWGEKLNLYSYRDMKYSVDAIRAFAGVLQRLETIYPKGFFFGMPVEDFDWALTWRSQVPPTRREGFPSWTWAGWKGWLFFGQPMDVEKTRRIPTYLDICASKAGRMEQIFLSKGDSITGTTGVRLIILEDPIHKTIQRETQGPEFQIDKYPTAEKDGYLFITATCLSFKPDFSKPLSGTYANGQNETFAFKIKDVRCLIRIYSMDRYIPGEWTGEHWIIDPNKLTEGTFILIARDHIQGFILHQLMLIKIQESTGLAERVTVMELLVPLDELEVLEEFKPRRQRIILV
ncbi:Heterokaryon incompatibility protein (HET) domain containing protein [Hyaloscypha variabilis]